MTTSAYDNGLAIRREVLGETHVNRSLDSADSLSRPLQQLVTEFAWGQVWSRESLPRTTKSLITIAMLIAGRHHDELRGHVRGAIRNGCSAGEIVDVVIHASVYCGFPASLSAMRVVQSALAELEAENPARQTGANS